MYNPKLTKLNVDDQHSGAGFDTHGIKRVKMYAFDNYVIVVMGLQQMAIYIF